MGYTETVCDVQGLYTALALPLRFRSVENIPMRYYQRLAELRKQRGLTQGELAERMNVEQPTVQRWEAGKREPSISTLQDIARALGVRPSEFFDERQVVAIGPELFIKGEVAAGVWRAAVEWPEDEWQTFTGRADVTADMQHRFGLRLIGDSMDLVYPPGTIVECVSLFGRAEAEPGKRVVVIRRDENDQFEATVKELVERDGELWLIPRSSNPAHAPIRLSDPMPGIVETRIAAVVVSSYRPE